MPARRGEDAIMDSNRDVTVSVSSVTAIGRFLTLRTAQPEAVALDGRGVLALALGCVGLWLALDWLSAGPDAEFYLYGLVGLGWYASVVLLIAGLWSWLAEPRIDYLRTLALTLAFVPVAMILTLLVIRHLPETLWLGALFLIALYATLYGSAALRSITARPQPRSLLAGLLALSLVAWFAHTQYVTPQFWYPPEDASADSSGDAQAYVDLWRQMEPLSFLQDELIDDAIAAVTRPDDLPAAAFFVGFAGMGEERVFAGEIDLAAQVIAAKYGTSTRSVRLINDRRDLTTYPFASPTALRHALAGLAQRMNLQQDVLFLALSSHGSEDGELSVSHGGIPLNNLAVEDLAHALRESGIKWRVIVVSACYSGRFIEPLRDDHTIIITAAAADRASFGCSDDRDLTYFGEAFYRDSLPAAPDLRTAFQRTKVLIAQREAAEDKEPSNPQAHFGTAIERHLRKLELPPLRDSET